MEEWIDEALYGMEGELLEVCRGWGKVRMFYGYDGWIPEKCWMTCRKKGQRKTVSALFADVKKKPDVRSENLFSVPRGSCLDTGETKGIWRRVFLPDGREGFVTEASLLSESETDKKLSGREEENRLRSRVIQTALGYLGVPYRWGGKTPQGIDCSGLVQMAYMLNSIVIYRDAKIVPGYPVRRIPEKRKKPGDLLYFPGHVAMYLGDGRYLHATAASDAYCVTINSLDPEDGIYREDLAGKLLMAGSVF